MSGQSPAKQYPGKQSPAKQYPGSASSAPAYTFPAGGTITLRLRGGTVTAILVRPGDDNVTTVVVEGRDTAIDRPAGSAFAFVPRFLNAAGEEYVPGTVHTKVVLRSTGAQIAALAEVSGWDSGDEIVAPGAWSALVTAGETREEHIVRIIGDNGNDNLRNELRMIIGCLNPER